MPFLYGDGRRTRTCLNGTVLRTVPRRRLDAADTIMQSSPIAGTKKADTRTGYGNSFEVYAADVDYQRSVSFSILKIGELSGGLSAQYRQATANRVQWGPMKAMRNLVAYNYGRMDQAIIRETATVDIPALLQFCQEQLSENDN